MEYHYGNFSALWKRVSQMEAMQDTRDILGGEIEKLDSEVAQIRKMFQ